MKFKENTLSKLFSQKNIINIAELVTSKIDDKSYRTKKIQDANTVILLNYIFMSILVLDVLMCAIKGNYMLMFSSVILIITLIISRIFIAKVGVEEATSVVSYTFYIIALYHTYFLDNIVIAYFALLVTPILSGILLRSYQTKIILFFLSVFLFFVCNRIAGLPYFENYLFFVALIPSFIGVLYFYERLLTLEKEKSKFIEELEQKNNEMILFSQMMGHDLKAPLNAIKNYSFLLDRKIDKDDIRQREFIDFIINNTKLMKNLIDDLLAYSKASTDLYHFESLNLSDLMAQQKATFQYQIEKNKVIFNEKNLIDIIGNKQSLQTVFQNLISNSIKYQPKNKENHIPEISIELIQTKLTYQIYFKDNGIGIKAKNIPLLFQPFMRFHSAFEYEGTGLGMSICKKILTKHNGDISVVESNENGTLFLIEIPINIE